MSSYGGNFLEDNWPLILLGIGILLIGIFMFMGVNEPADTRTYYSNFVNTDTEQDFVNNFTDNNPRNRIRHNDEEAFGMQDTPLDSSTQILYTFRGRRRRPWAVNNTSPSTISTPPSTISTPESTISTPESTESTVLIPPLPNQTLETSTRPTLRKLPRLSSRNTNQKFGSYSENNSNQYMNTKVGQESIGPNTFGQSNRRTSKRVVPY